MINIKKIYNAAILWAEQHWKYVTSTLLCIIILQQCSLSRLQRQLEAITTLKTQTATTQPAQPEPVATAPTDTAEQDTTAAETEVVEPATEQPTSSNLPAVLAAIALIALGGALFYMKRSGAYPIGLWVGGKLRQTASGELAIRLTVKNRSAKEIEAAEPIVSFFLPGGQRKFRASIPEMPITLQPGTSYSTEVNISKLISANLELMQAKAIGVSCQCNGKRHASIPSPVRISQK